MEGSERVGVVGERPRHPIEQQTESGVVAGLDKSTEIVGRPVSAGWRKQRDWLISPGTVERIFGKRHGLDMSKAHVAHVRHELVGELTIGQVPPLLGKIAAPRAEMHFVNRDRRLAVIAPPALYHPSAVMPHMA